MLLKCTVQPGLMLLLQMTGSGFRKVLAAWNRGSTFTEWAEKKIKKEKTYIYNKKFTAKYGMGVIWL